MIVDPHCFDCDPVLSPRTGRRKAPSSPRKQQSTSSFRPSHDLSFLCPPAHHCCCDRAGAFATNRPRGPIVASAHLRLNAGKESLTVGPSDNLASVSICPAALYMGYQAPSSSKGVQQVSFHQTSPRCSPVAQLHLERLNGGRAIGKHGENQLLKSIAWDLDWARNKGHSFQSRP